MVGPLARAYQVLQARQHIQRDFEDLSPLRRVDAALGQPGSSCRVVQVLGTNGKGSTASMLAALGLGLGQRVGLYTSPHLHSVRERIQIDGQPITADAFADALGQVEAAERACGEVCSFFELLTLAAFVAFEARQLEYLVLEAGLGGRLDATTQRRAELQLYARIGLDHQAILGDTVAAIAGEKAAAMWSGAMVASAPQPLAALAVLRQRAQGLGLHLRELSGLDEPPPHLPGDHQRDNAALALWAARQLFAPELTEYQAREIWQYAEWPGRAELCRVGDAEVLFDVGHNADAIKAWLDAQASRKFDVIILGCLGDKSAEEIAIRVEPTTDELWLVPPPHPRAYLWPQRDQPGVRQFTSVTEAGFQRHLQQRLGGSARVAVLGSHALVAALRAQLLNVDSGQCDPEGLFDGMPTPA